MKIIGACEIETNRYTFPTNAKKSEKYKCPECNEDLIFKKGQIVVPHFSHKSNSKCTYYDHPSESQIYKDAKNKLAQWLQDKKPLRLKTKCSSCNGPCKNKKIKDKI
jgi:competence CoiA-like predicted nuclease